MRQAAARQRQRRQRRLIKSPLSYSHAAMPGPLFLSLSPSLLCVPRLGEVSSFWTHDLACGIGQGQRRLLQVRIRAGPVNGTRRRRRAERLSRLPMSVVPDRRRGFGRAPC